MPFSPIRQFKRYAVDLAVIRTGSSARLERVENLSRGGALVRSAVDLDLGSRHTFLFVLPDGAQPTVVPMRAQIAWRTAQAAGLWFLGADPRIDGFIEALARANPLPLIATPHG